MICFNVKIMKCCLLKFVNTFTKKKSEILSKTHGNLFIPSTYKMIYIHIYQEPKLKQKATINK